MADHLRWRWLGLAGSIALAVGGLASPLCGYFGLVLLTASWWQLRYVAAQGTRALVWTLVTWSVPLALGPPLFSRDVYSYLAQGAIAVAGLDVYTVGPSALGGPLAVPIPALWQHTPAPYGPVFVWLATVVSQVTGADTVAGVFAMRTVALLSLALLATCLPRLAQASGTDPGLAVWLGVLNPLVLLHFVAGAHNDALMAALLTAGLTAAALKRPVLASVLVTLAGLVKAPAFLGLLAIVYVTQKSRQTIRSGVTVGVTTVVTAAVVTVVTGRGFGWVSALDTPISSSNWSLSGLLGRLTGDVSLWRWICLATAGAIALVVWRKMRWDRPVEALGITLLTLAFLGPALRTWYPLWGLILLATAIPHRKWPAVVSGVLALAIFPHGYPPDAGEVGLAVVGGALALSAVWMTTRMSTMKAMTAQAK